MAVAQVRILVQDFAQGVRRDLVDFAISPGNGGNERRAAGQLPHVAGEVAGAVGPNSLRLLGGFVHNLEFTGLDDVKPGIPVAGLEELLPGSVAPQRCPGAAVQRGQVGFVELGKGDRVQVMVNLLTPGARAVALPQVRRNLLRHVHLRLIDIAPGPAFAGLVGRHHGMGRMLEMFRGMASR